MLDPEIETEDDMQVLMSGHEELVRLLLRIPRPIDARWASAVRRLTSLRELNERQELQRAKHALEEKDR